jgi:hypothetical protein
MRRPLWTAVAPAVFGAALTVAVGQSPAPKPPAYDVRSEVTVRGKVIAVAAIPDWMGTKGVNVTLETPESVTVHVDTAPSEFLQMLDFPIATGDELEVTGVWSHWGGNRVFLARTLARQKVVVLVRDTDGKPVW